MLQGKHLRQPREEKSTALWVDFEAVYEKTCALERLKDAHSRDLNPSEEVIVSYLRQELDECAD